MQDTTTPYSPTEEDRRSLDEWFARYDALAARGEVEAMASMAVFPMNLVTDGADGEAWTGQWDRAEYVRTMTAVMPESAAQEVHFTSERTPHFLSGSLALVFTDSTMTVGDSTQRMRYADVLVKQGGEWRFQTMIQGGWADALTGRTREGGR
ncbi:Cif family virulence factor [Streptomyces daliensis]|uniref:Nuclear transport factor 2 family protein n=1 Tax=Streptomyces daliensis TaxID=299421 RepID=A0A8T4J0X0_9ACTN|nr:nuclear transport factor 2 family protein [Streptomyces daliensis]